MVLPLRGVKASRCALCAPRECVHAPKAHPNSSPGQRPGKHERRIDEALKGRSKKRPSLEFNLKFKHSARARRRADFGLRSAFERVEFGRSILGEDLDAEPRHARDGDLLPVQHAEYLLACFRIGREAGHRTGADGRNTHPSECLSHFACRWSSRSSSSRDRMKRTPRATRTFLASLTSLAVLGFLVLVVPRAA